MVAGAGEAEVLAETFDLDAAGIIFGETQEGRADARVFAPVFDEEQQDVRRGVFEERRDERRQQSGVVVNRDHDRERRLGRGLGAEAGPDGLLPDVRAQFADEPAYRGCGRLPSGEEAGVQEQGVPARRHRVGRKGRASRGEAPPFAPADRAVVQERGREAASRDIGIDPGVEVAVEEPAAGGGHEVAGEPERLMRGSARDGGKGAGDADGGAQQPKEPDSAGEGFPEDGEGDFRRGGPTGRGERAEKDPHEAGNDVRRRRIGNIKPGAVVGEGGFGDQPIPEGAAREPFKDIENEMVHFIGRNALCGKRAETGGEEVAEPRRERCGNHGLVFSPAVAGILE